MCDGFAVLDMLLDLSEKIIMLNKSLASIHLRALSLWVQGSFFIRILKPYIHKGKCPKARLTQIFYHISAQFQSVLLAIFYWTI